MNDAVNAELDRLLAYEIFATQLIYESGAILVNGEKPFKLASGNYSPIYIDMRVCLGKPEILNILIDLAVLQLKVHQAISYFHDDFIIAGMETGGALYGQLLASKMNKRFTGIRKQEKSYGTKGLFIGSDLTSTYVLLVDDTTTDGGSKIKAIDSILQTGAKVEDCFTFMDREQGTQNLLSEKYNCSLKSLSNMHSILETLGKYKYCTPEALAELWLYYKRPDRWHEMRGLDYNEPHSSLSFSNSVIQ